MRMRKHTAGLFAAVLAAGLISAMPAVADEALYEMENGILEVSDYDGVVSELVIPAEYNGEAVWGISGPASEDLTSVTLSEGIVSLEPFSWWNCQNLTDLNLPDSLQSIGENAASGNDALEEITIPAGVRFIGTDAFESCYNLRSITFIGRAPIVPDDKPFEYIAEDAVFYVPDDCVEEYMEILPDGAVIETTGAEAVVFESDTADFTVDAEGTLTAYTGGDAVVEIPAEVDGTAVTAIGEDCFRLNKHVHAVSIPEGVTAIGDGAFEETYSMETVQLPSSIRTIGKRAFKNCFAADRIPDIPEGVEIIEDEAFSHTRFTGELYLPEGLLSIGADAFNYANISEVYFPASIASIGDRAFYNSAVNYVVFAVETMPEMGEDVFDGDIRKELLDVDLPWDASRSSWETAKEYFDALEIDGLTVWRSNPSSAGVASRVTLDEGTYEDGFLTSYSGEGSDLTVYTAVDGVRVIGLGAGAFAGSQTIRSFYPHHCDWFTTIGSEAFADSTLEYIEMYDSITTIESGAFKNCTNLTEILLPQFLTDIAADAFEGCTNLEKIVVACDPAVVPEELLAGTSAGIYASADASDEQVAALSKLTGRKWYESVPREGEEETSSLIAMPDTDYAPESDFEINEEGTIREYTGTASRVVIPRTINGIEVTAIGYGAFMSQEEYGPDEDIPANTTLEEVIIPETVRSIESMAFLNTTALKSVTCYGPLENMEDMVFADSSIESINFVNGVYEIGPMAFQNATSLTSVDFGGHVEVFQFSAFRNTGLTEVHIPASVTLVDQSAFYECGSLTSVCFETSDISILESDQAFGETAITQVNLPEDTDEDTVNMFYNKLNNWNGGPLTDKSQIVLGGCTHSAE